MLGIAGDAIDVAPCEAECLIVERIRQRQNLLAAVAFLIDEDRLCAGWAA